jgi:DNA repair protein RadA/Sms
VRPVSQASQRLKEAQKLGFTRAVLPVTSIDKDAGTGPGLQGIDQLTALVATIAASGTRPERRAVPDQAERRRQTVADEALDS